MKANIVIADEHILIRRGVTAMITELSPVANNNFAKSVFSVLGDTASPTQLMALLADNQVDILFVGFSLATLQSNLVDSKLPREPLLKGINRLYPAMKTVVISPYKNALLVRNALEAGAMGYIGRDSCEKTLQRTLHSVMNGRVYVERDLMASLLRRDTGSLTGMALTKRETEVLHKLYQGLQQPEISTRMNLSNKTVSAHKMHAMAKLNVKNECHLYCLMAIAQMFDASV
ncbi:response regulator transcription factor [Pantoea cypripedii]|uniref:response regulator transcription factor n=1 Tax=Pantoea cypripedii TaxID=55209 RepID=UPI002FC91060